MKQLAVDSALRLHAQSIEDADATLLGRLLETRSHLTHLDLSGNKLDTGGAAAIAQALAQSGTPLQELNVAGNRLRSSAAASLLHGVLALRPSALRLLDLSRNPIAEAASGAYDTQVVALVGHRRDGAVQAGGRRFDLF